uniref:Processing of 4, ribonuclease P/MRP subunit n=1 Tax=Nothobranchius korthausae TaxID=1143690 RepID=A0A1A8FM12_9TELE
MDGEALLCATVPSELKKAVDVEPPSSSKAAAFTEAFLKNSIKTPARLDLNTLLTHKAVILGYTRPKKDTTKRKSKKAKGLGARQKRVMKIFQIKAEHQRYELFLPLHQLWRHYIFDLCGGLKPSSSPQLVQQKLLKADLHGAILTGRCWLVLGVAGTVLNPDQLLVDFIFYFLLKDAARTKVMF